MQHVEAGLVGGVPGALDLHAAEGSHGDGAVRVAAPGATPVFQLQQFARCFLDEGLDCILIGEPVGATDGVVTMVVVAVAGLDHRGGSAFSGDGMRAHRVDLGDDTDRQVGIFFADGDGCAQTSTASSNDENVMAETGAVGSTHREFLQMKSHKRRGTLTQPILDITRSGATGFQEVLPSAPFPLKDDAGASSGG